MNLTQQRRRYRLIASLLLVGGSALVALLMAWAVRENLNAYVTPGDPELAELAVGDRVTIGGLVAPESVVYNATRSGLRFVLMDGAGQVEVVYARIPPDLFAEGSGAVVSGIWQGAGRIEARNIMAKHDENYVPRILEEALPQ